MNRPCSNNRFHLIPSLLLLSLVSPGLTAEIFEQLIEKSKSKMKYYYAAETPLLILQVEKPKPGKSPVTLTLRQVNWDL
jgi:hypothetical protein